MSEIKVNSIKGVGASAAAITVNNTDGTCTANITNKPNRNLVINGAMQVAQRGTSSTSNGYGSVDRFRVVYTSTDEAPTQSQADVASGTTPYTLGFRKSLKVTNGNQTGGAGSSDDIQINCRLEGQDIAGSGWNYTSSSSFITLSFYVKSSVAQNFYGYVRSNSGTIRSHPFETGSLSADTWTKVTKTFSGDSNITINNDNTTGFNFFLNAFLGTDLTDNGVSLTAWNTYSSSSITPDNTSTWYTTNDATLEITGVQLEVSDHATSFEFLSFADELTRCERYYQVIIEGMGYEFVAVHHNSSRIQGTVRLRPKMRTSPSIVQNSGSDYYRFYRSSGSDGFSSFSGLTGSTNRAATFYNDSEVSGTAGIAGTIYANNSSSLVALNAEL